MHILVPGAQVMELKHPAGPCFSQISDIFLPK